MFAEPQTIIGRSKELEDLGQFLDGIEAGPIALVLDGELGIGKTVLWKAGLTAAADRSYRVLVCRPIESDAQLAYAALGDLLTEVPAEALGELPEPQRQADERIGLLVTGRSEGSSTLPLDLERAFVDGRLGHLRIGSLGPAELDRLLVARLDTRLSEQSLLGVHDRSGGNPFFALELGRAMQQRDDPPTGADDVPIPASLHELVISADGGRALHQPQDGAVEPLEALPQARHRLTDRAACATRRRARPVPPGRFLARRSALIPATRPISLVPATPYRHEHGMSHRDEKGT